MDSKSSPNWLGIQDYFNYYLPGLIWFADFTLIIILANQFTISIVLGFFTQINTFALLGMAIVIPYLVGLMFNSTGFMVIGIDKILFGKPETYVLDPGLKKTLLNLKFGSSLGSELRKNVTRLVSERFNISPKSSSVFPNVRYSLQLSPHPQIQNHISRLTNLINLHEGMIIPILFGAILLFITPTALFPSSRLLALLLLIATASIWKKYHYLRELRAKQVFRYFYLWQVFEEKPSSDHFDA